LRADIRHLQAAGGSLMPAEIEKEIAPEAMAHLIQFLKETPRPFEALTAEEMAKNKELVLKTGHNGLARVLRFAGQDRQASWAGAMTMYYARQLDGKQEVAWQTDPAPPAVDPTARTGFRFPIAMGYASQPSGLFTLYADDKKLLDFNVSLDSAQWMSADGRVILKYHAEARNAEDSTGLMELELPASLLDPGKPLTLRVLGSAANSRRWFGLLPLR